jgi:multidrug resistance efflux pump
MAKVSIIEESQKAKLGIFRFFLKKKVLIPLIIIIISGGAYYYFVYYQNQTAPVVSTQKQAKVNKEDLKISIQSDGKVVAKDGVELSFPVSGNLEVDEVYVKEGDKVKKGDKIASVKTENLEFELRNAYASYQSSLANLNSKQAGATDAEIKKAKASIDQSQISLDQAKISLEKTTSSANQSIESAQNSLNSAQNSLKLAENNLKLDSNSDDSQIVRDAYSDMITTLLSVDVSLQKMLRDSDNIVGVDERSVNDSFEEALGAKNGSALNDAKNSYSEAKVQKLALDTATASLSLDRQSGIESAIKIAESALAEMQAHLLDMQVLLDNSITFSGFSQDKLDSFKSTINSNRSSVNSSLSSLNNGKQSISNAKNSLTSAEISYDNASNAYNKALKDLELAKKQAQQDIDTANINLKSRELDLTQAKNDYEELIAPVKEIDLASARAQLTSAAISVDKAKYNVEQATLTSPIDGVVSMLNYKKGDIILDTSDNKNVATIINNDTLFIEVNIEEADISKLSVGNKAEASFDAIDGLVLNGEVSFISMTSETNSNGIVTYLVRVLLNDVSDSPIREGMTASVEFITAEAENVLTVPVAAVRNVSGQPSVQKADGSYATVVTGFTDGKKVEIISGLEEGEQIIY